MSRPRPLTTDRPAGRTRNDAPRPAALVAAAALGLAAILPGCGDGVLGYRSEPLYDRDIATIAVPIFENRTFERGVEFDLTEAVIKEIELRTPYKVVRAGRADSQLLGAVVSVDRRVFSRVPDAAVPQESQFLVKASFQWKNLRSGEVMARRSRIAGSGEYVPTPVVGEVYETAQHEAVAELARDIVATMRSDW